MDVVRHPGAGVTGGAAATLLVWRNGNEATFTVFGGKGRTAAKALAKKVVGRL